MFTGIITATTAVTRAERRGKNRRVAFRVPKGWAFKKGESVAVDGICTTVVQHSRTVFEVDYMPTTLKKTTAGEFAPARIVNLERPLKYEGRVDGYFVLGHVDGTAPVAAVEGPRITLRMPKPLMRYIIPRGSVTVNGVALTVADVKGSLATVALIPYTASHTNLGALEKGDRVNVEIDLLARYATKALRKRN
jgi:riboflavin synthase